MQSSPMQSSRDNLRTVKKTEREKTKQEVGPGSHSLNKISEVPENSHSSGSLVGFLQPWHGHGKKQECQQCPIRIDQILFWLYPVSGS